jgi:hypothetical protein
MLKTLTLTIAACALSALLAADAGALPAAPAQSAGIEDSDVTLVRQGCGRGWRYSEMRGRCVPDRGSQINCPPGFHWSIRYKRCFRN